MKHEKIESSLFRVHDFVVWASQSWSIVLLRLVLTEAGRGILFSKLRMFGIRV